MKTSILVAVAVAVASLTAGCSGKLYTVMNPDLTKTNDNGEVKVEGILLYPKINVMELYKSTILTDKESGNIIGKAPIGCTATHSAKYATRTDFTKPYRIYYDAGPLETNKFSVTLEDGALKSVNTESDPSKGITAATGALTGLLPFVVGVPTLIEGQGPPPCNAGAKLEGVYEAPPVQPNPTTSN